MYSQWSLLFFLICLGHHLTLTQQKEQGESARIFEKIKYSLNSRIIQTNDNVTLTCKLARVCPVEDLNTLCTAPESLRWFLPNSLSPDQSESRIQILGPTFTVGKLPGPNETQNVRVNVESQVQLFKIGFRQEGLYQCSGINAREVKNVQIQVAKDYCEYDDQCKSLNCYDNLCRCKTINDNYDPDVGCVRRKMLGEGCTHSSECSSKKMITSQGLLEEREDRIECLDNVCSCTPGTVPVSVAYSKSAKVCMSASLRLGDICFDSEQCAGTGSFCGLDLSTGKLTCQCRDGWWSNNNNGSHCIPHRKCNSTVVEFNEQFLAGFGCLDNQFCRENFCLCAPNYIYDDSGNCVRTSNPADSFFTQHWKEILIGTGGVVGFVALVGIFTYTKKSRNNRKHRNRPAGDVLNMGQVRRSQRRR